MTNRLYYGDNLEILREEIKDESVDLIYLDPPFNSKRDYNLLFKTPKGQRSDAQITAFEDSWHWGPQAERELHELTTQPNTDVAQLMQAGKNAFEIIGVPHDMEAARDLAERDARAADQGDDQGGGLRRHVRFAASRRISEFADSDHRRFAFREGARAVSRHGDGRPDF
jgi:hypothetical protein